MCPTLKRSAGYQQCVGEKMEGKCMWTNHVLGTKLVVVSEGRSAHQLVHIVKQPAGLGEHKS